MESPQNQTPEQDGPARWEEPTLSDYGTLVELTAAAGNLIHSDLPHGMPNTSYPS